jgi:acetate kinase
MTEAHVLVINCGSSSIKLALIEPASGATVWQALGERIGAEGARMVVTRGDGARQVTELPGADHERALDAALGELPAVTIAAIGHRVVHGGEAFADSVILSEESMDAIARCVDLAPLHNAFHQTMPRRAYLYAVPYELYETHQIRRYGFHGTSHRFVSERAAELLGRPAAAVNVITAHLGNGCSAAAVRAGRSADTTMGLTPLEGLVMGTRSGDVDPNLHQFLVDHAGMTLSQVTDLLTKRSGLLGLSGESNDMRNLLELERAGNARAGIAIDVFCYRLAKALLGLCAALPALDAIVFTGGIGENSAAVRERTVSHLSVLGATLDEGRNAAHGRASHAVVSRDDSPVVVLVVPTNEELVIAREAMRLVSSGSGEPLAPGELPST